MGILLCFVLVEYFRHQQISRVQLAKATSVAPGSTAMMVVVTNGKSTQIQRWEPPDWMAGVSRGETGVITNVGMSQFEILKRPSWMSATRVINITNTQIGELQIRELQRWVGPPPGRPGPGYSFDLIDDIHPVVLPMPAER